MTNSWEERQPSLRDSGGKEGRVNSPNRGEQGASLRARVLANINVGVDVCSIDVRDDSDASQIARCFIISRGSRLKALVHTSE